VTFTKGRERGFEPTDIHHPLHPLHHLVLEELEEWVEADEGWQDFPESPDELHALERRQPEAPSRQRADGDECVTGRRSHHRSGRWRTIRRRARIGTRPSAVV
jgi:hypothetical protein